MPVEKKIWTIGHSTREEKDFLSLLTNYKIEVLADVRRYPHSVKFPQFNHEHLEMILPQVAIEYRSFIDLGGRRNPKKDSVNTAWRLPAFRGYADYMESDAFKSAIEKLEDGAIKNRTAYMCSEAPWWKCHRALVSDFLKVRGWKVNHIMESGKITEHPYTSPARAEQGQLFYDEVSPERHSSETT